jgi:DNA-binding response OmpR family regulator
MVAKWSPDDLLDGVRKLKRNTAKSPTPHDAPIHRLLDALIAHLEKLATGFTVDLDINTMYVDGQKVCLTSKQAEVAHVLCRTGTATYEQIENGLYGQWCTHANPRRGAQYHVHRFKERLSKVGYTIRNQQGTGYYICAI